MESSFHKPLKEAYKLVVLYFGITNASVIFQTMVNDILKDMRDVVVVYINEIQIFMKGKMRDKHDQIV